MTHPRLCYGLLRLIAIDSLITRVVEAEVLAAAREQGIASLGDVEAIVLETDGTFSVVQSPDPGTTADTLRNLRGT